MKIETKFYVTHAVNIGLIVVMGAFLLYNSAQVLTKLRFIEFADDLNAAFLEMRLSEKNHFLYGDESALREIESRIQATDQALDRKRDDICRAVGEEKFDHLRQLLADYRGQVSEIRLHQWKESTAQRELRASGQRLMAFSEETTSLERQQVGIIIERTTAVLRYAFVAVVALAVFLSVFGGRSIRRSLQRIVALTRSISKGDFRRIEETPHADEMGAVILAINAMAEELGRREQEIVQSKRLASIGILVAGVAHELNNPLNNISMLAQTYAEVYEKLDDARRIDFMNQVDAQAERLRVTIRNLLDYAKPTDQHLEERQANEVVRKALGLVQNMLDVSGIRTRMELSEGLPPVYVDEHRIQQVLVNMEVNAIQAMTSGGELTLATRYLADSDTVEISVRDTGKGIPKELLDHVFDPFFTTKGDSGSGLGLWVSYGIIKNHGGSLHVESVVGAGTTFTIHLPASAKLKRSSHAA